MRTEHSMNRKHTHIVYNTDTGQPASEFCTRRIAKDIAQAKNDNGDGNTYAIMDLSADLGEFYNKKAKAYNIERYAVQMELGPDGMQTPAFTARATIHVEYMRDYNASVGQDMAEIAQRWLMVLANKAIDVCAATIIFTTFWIAVF